MTTAIPGPCDHAIPAGPNQSRQAQVGTLVAVILASSLAFLDGSATNVALAAMRREFGPGTAGILWVFNGYLLPLSALTLFGGATGDRFGHRRMFLLGILGFALASTFCFLAIGLGSLIASRFAQGVAAAVLLPNSLAVLGAEFSGEERGRAVGTWAAASAAVSAIGPLVGGWLVVSVGWRYIFLLNLPLACGAIWLAAKYVPEPVGHASSPLDWLGALLATLSLGALTWGITVFSEGLRNASSLTWVTVSIGMLGVPSFLLVERNRGVRAMLPLAVLADKQFIGLNVFTLLLYGALSGLFVLLPYFLIESQGYSPSQAGAALLPIPIALTFVSRGIGRFYEHVGARPFLVSGSASVAIGLALISTAANSPYAQAIFLGVFVIALGTAVAVAPLTDAVMASVDRSHIGIANGLNSAAARAGGMVVTAILGPVLSSSGGQLPEAYGRAALAGALLCVLATTVTLFLVHQQARGITSD